MPSACCAVGCTNRNTPESGLVFYRIPKKNGKTKGAMAEGHQKGKLVWKQSFKC